jgi:hypothetical protein
MGKVYGPYSRRNRPTHLPKYEYIAHGTNAIDVVRKLAPYLSQPKLDQALKCFERERAHRSRKAKQTSLF